MEVKSSIGLYEPTEEEQINCLENGLACEFGICSECIIGSEGSSNVY